MLPDATNSNSVQNNAAPLHDVATIETPEQIELNLTLAGVGSRSVAYVIDLLWQTLPIMAGVFALVALLPFQFTADDVVTKGEDGQPRFSLIAIALVSGTIFFINFGYFAFFEMAWKGQSPGKRAMGLRVIRDGGYPIDGRAALVRNLLRVVDSLPNLYLVGIAALFVGRKGKRVGDYAAGTLVIRERKPQFAQTPVSSKASGPLSASERSLVEEFLERRTQLLEDARERVGRDIAHRLARRLGHPPPGDAEHYLEELLGHEHR